jgi:hypothetical protein
MIFPFEVEMHDMMNYQAADASLERRKAARRPAKNLRG